MLGGFLKLILSFSALFFFVTIVWQASIANALPTLGADENMVKSNDDASRPFTNNIYTGGLIVKRSLHSTIDQNQLIDRSYLSSRQRHSKKKSNFNPLKSSFDLFQSTGTYNKNLRAAKRIKAVLENRLKRFRMLDQDEFQEMLKTLSQQPSDEQSKTPSGIDAIGGMQLANYWSPN